MQTYHTMAIAYDFDGTLAPGNMQEHKFIPELGIGKRDFWEQANELAERNDMDGILAYMQLMLQKAKENNLPINKSAFENYGKTITFFNGVETYFDRINSYAHKKKIIIEHHVISSGLREFIHGTSIAKYFKNIFASGFKYNDDDIAEWPALAINYTNKTQYLFRINKGIDNSWDDTLINQYIPDNLRPIPFKDMIYIGDGETDVPAMKMIKYQQGTAVAVFNPAITQRPGKESPRKICLDLVKNNRADYIAPADYRENSALDRIIKRVIDKIACEYELLEIKSEQMSEYWQ